MTRDETIDLARQSGLADHINATAAGIGALERFAALVEARTASISAALLQSKDAQIETCRAEAARLDYLQHTGSTVEIITGPTRQRILNFQFRIGGLRASADDSIRAAIDKARSAGGPIPRAMKEKTP